MSSDTPRTDALARYERHLTVSETRYWCNQFKLIARQLERELKIQDDANEILTRNLAEARAELAAAEAKRREDVRKCVRIVLRADSAESPAKAIRAAFPDCFDGQPSKPGPHGGRPMTLRECAEAEEHYEIPEFLRKKT